MARETWWLDPEWLEPVISRPLAMDEMDQSIPYKLAPERAVAFYVQSAAFVACIVEARNWGLRDLFETLRSGADSAGAAMMYDLPEVERDSFVRGCLEGWRQ
jgi:hypothetical protein